MKEAKGVRVLKTERITQGTSISVKRIQSTQVVVSNTQIQPPIALTFGSSAEDNICQICPGEGTITAPRRSTFVKRPRFGNHTPTRTIPERGR
jgi:hypothetical protein